MNADNIRIVRHIGVLSEVSEGFRTEFNIVSIDNSDYQYDIREWSLDYSDYRDGISLDNESAKRLFAYLSECYKNGGDEILLDIGTIANHGDEIAMFLKQSGIEYVDKRDSGGALWVIGGHELNSIMMKCEELGYKFSFSEKGGKVTKKQPGWYCSKK